MANHFSPTKRVNRLMLGFIVRRCAAELGHSPTPEEFAAWANNREEDGQRYSLFGQPISAQGAKVMLRHPGRLVTVHAQSVVNSPRAMCRRKQKESPRGHRSGEK